MKNHILASAVAAAITVTPCALAQSSGGDFSITRSVIGTGGGASSGGGFSLVGTVGQAQTGFSQGGEFSVSGGFWTAGERPTLVFLDGFEGAP
ncbi:MAG: hypothetical protein QNJ40_05675 [Xanthomonadales bacterium]|nr:hypothetical protein [Xanthomonadales bacterium]